MATDHGMTAMKPGIVPHGEMVEIGLLLTPKRVDALVELSKRRHQSVAQILRGLIDRALTDEELAPARP